MSDIYLTKKERKTIYTEAFVYICFVLFACYLTVFGNTFVRMIPMLYILGIIGRILFKRPIETTIFGFITILVFGFLLESKITWVLVSLAIYSSMMIIFGNITGYILKLLYENYMQRKFIKYYKKIGYIMGLVFALIVPLMLNNLVNSNPISYFSIKSNLKKHINEKYNAKEYNITNVNYIPSYEGGIYKFNMKIENIDIIFKSNNENMGFIDENLEERKLIMNNNINLESERLLQDNNIKDVKIISRYDYSKLLLLPDQIKILLESENENIDEIIKVIDIIKKWNKNDKVERIDILIGDKGVSINKRELEEKVIDVDYIKKGIEQEFLDGKEGTSNGE
ncbi:MAG: hypothetical protein PHE29_11180 [Tissierellia bacterium]|nr:hypothetical protein [Tissierellia bacterium]